MVKEISAQLQGQLADEFGEATVSAEAPAKKSKKDQPTTDFLGLEVHKVSGVLIREGELVLVQRDALNKEEGGPKRVVWWELPGGKPNFQDETAEDVVVRELLEEIGVTTIPEARLGVDTHPRDANRLVGHFLCAYVSGEIYNAAPREHLDVKSFSPKKLSKLVDGADVRVPQAILDEFIHTGQVNHQMVMPSKEAALVPSLSP